jgi:uncharacterized protein (DUF4415 family)
MSKKKSEPSERLRGARRAGRPPTGRAKQLIAIRIPPTVLHALRRLARKKKKPYQTLINELLAAATRRAA